MKKIIMGLSGLIVLTFVIIYTISAQNNDQKTRKTNSEVSQNIPQYLSTARCPGLPGSKMANCCSSDTTAMNCNAAKCKEGKCDPEKCMGGKCDPAVCNGCQCGQATCSANCRELSAEMRCGPMNCNRQELVQK